MLYILAITYLLHRQPPHSRSTPQQTIPARHYPWNPQRLSPPHEVCGQPPTASQKA